MLQEKDERGRRGMDIGYWREIQKERTTRKTKTWMDG
jgi:hypothetical protein